MTTAYDFPDLNISPILGEESDNQVEEPDVPIQDILKGLSISGETSSRNVLLTRTPGSESSPNAENPSACQPQSDSYDSSSEGVFAALEREMKRSLFSVAESTDIGANPQESFSSILSGCRISVEMGCCLQSSEEVRTRLRSLGAVVTRRVTETTTHVVFSYGGDAAVLRRVFSMTRRPFLVDPHWVYECFKRRIRVSEEQFSLYDCRFLVNTLRRSTDAHRTTENKDVQDDNVDEHGNHVNEERYLTRSEEDSLHGCVLTYPNALNQIDLLSKRLDRIGGLPSCVLGNRCPSALRGKAWSSAVPQLDTIKDFVTKSINQKVLRRRSYSGVPLEYRDPHCRAVQLMQEVRDEQEAISGRIRRCEHSEMKKQYKISELACAAGVCKTKAHPETADEAEQTEHFSDRERRCLASIENSSSEIRGLLGFRPPSHGGIYSPLVDTASSLINQLQAASTSEEFVIKKQPRTLNKGGNGVVFTGFAKEREKNLYSHVSSLGLRVQAKISPRTYCVISAHGERTLNTLRAVIMGIPVVKHTWIDASLKENGLLSLELFHHKRWQHLIEKRKQQCDLFSDVGKILVCNECSPPTEDLEWMIRQSGGKVTTNPSECVLVVAPRNHSMEISCSEDVDSPLPVVVEKFILDCISENKLLPFDDYMEHDVIDDLC